MQAQLIQKQEIIDVAAPGLWAPVSIAKGRDDTPVAVVTFSNGRDSLEVRYPVNEGMTDDSLNAYMSDMTASLNAREDAFNALSEHSADDLTTRLDAHMQAKMAQPSVMEQAPAEPSQRNQFFAAYNRLQQLQGLVVSGIVAPDDAEFLSVQKQAQALYDPSFLG